MAQDVQIRPGSEEENEDYEVYDPESTAVGDPSDPRGDLPSGVKMGSAGDPGAQARVPVRSKVYDKPGSEYSDDEQSPEAGPMDDAANPGGELKDIEDGAGAGQQPAEDGGKTASPAALKDREAEGDKYKPDGGGEDQEEDGFYNEDADSTRRQRSGMFFRRHKKKIGIGGGISALLLGGGIGLFSLLLPLKIEHIVSNLQGTFFSTTEQSLGQETRNMVKSYLITRVMPGYKSCGSTIKAGCSARKFGSNPVSEMYRSWADARIERQLANKGIVLEYKRLSGKWYLETPSIKNGSVDIGANGERLGAEIDNHAELRAALDKTIKDETKWYQVYARFKWGRYFERKFGLPRCIISCKLLGHNIVDPLHTKIKNKKISAALYITQRVITPHNQTLGIALECLIQDCVATDNQPSGSDGENGTPESEVDSKIKKALVAYGGARLTNVSEEELLKAYKDIEEVGLQKFLISKALTPIIGETAAGTAGDVIPIAGWVNLASQIVNAGNDAGGNLEKLRYDVNGAADAAMFATFLVYADEIHTGGADATEVGSFTNSLGPGDQGASDGNPVGGTAGAEQTKLYQNLIEGKKNGGNAAASTASLNNLLVGKASAATAADVSSGAAGEICNSGTPPAANQMICPEDFLGGGNSIANGVHDFLNLPGINVITIIAEGWKATIGQVFKFGGDIIGSAFTAAMAPFNAACDVPVVGAIVTVGYCPARDLAKKEIPKIVEGVTKWLIPDPFGVPMGGGRTFVSAAGGADFTGNDSCHRTLGCQAITPEQKARIVDVQQQEERQQFTQESFFARMFNTDSQYSLVSKLAMDIPLGNQAMVHSGLANLMNPFGALSNGFGSIFSARASAATAALPDPFGITQYGYPIGTIPGDPETYWDNHCSDNAANAYQKDNSWNEAASGTSNADPNTGDPLNKTTNPCLLIKAAVGAGGGLFDTKNLTPDDLADLQGPGAGGDGAPTGSIVPQGGVAFPFPPQVGIVPPSSWTQDQGVDIATDGAACGKAAPEVAMGTGKIVGRGISGFGPDAPILHITEGPLADRYIYYGHAGDAQNSNGAGRPPHTEVGDKVTAGQVITYTGCGDVPSPTYSSGPHLEIGIWAKGTKPSDSFPSMNETSAEMLKILTQAYQAQGNK